MVLWLSFVGLLFHTAVYAYVWFNYYYPAISKFTARFKFYKNGHLLILGIYFVLLFFFFHIEDKYKLFHHHKQKILHQHKYFDLPYCH